MVHALSDVYFAALERERYELREATCQGMLAVFNQELDGHAKSIQEMADKQYSKDAPGSRGSHIPIVTSGSEGTDPSWSGYGIDAVGGALGGGSAGLALRLLAVRGPLPLTGVPTGWCFLARSGRRRGSRVRACPRTLRRVWRWAIWRAWGCRGGR